MPAAPAPSLSAAVAPGAGPAPTIAAVARGVLATQYERMRAHAPGVLQDRDPDHVHDMRVAIRRARCALRLFEAPLDAAACRQVRRELSWLAGLLGGVRDMDVMLTHLKQQYKVVAADKKSRDALRACCLAARVPAFVRMQDGMLSARYACTLKALAALLPVQPADAACPPAALEGARILRTLIKRTLKAVPACATSGALHGMRIQCKKLRYACEFLGPHVGDAVRELVKPLVAVQDCLGRHQDAQVTQAFLRHCANVLAQRGELAPEPLLMIGALLHCERTVAAARCAAFDDLSAAFVRQATRLRTWLGERIEQAHAPAPPGAAPADTPAP